MTERTIYWLDLQNALAIYHHLSDKFPSHKRTINEAYLASALASPQQHYHYEAHTDLFELAALLLCASVKRMLLVMEINGWDLFLV